MFVLVLAAENDETRQTVTFLIACLVGIAIVLAMLTIWYWFYTDPKRQRQRRDVARSGPEIVDPAVDQPEAAREATEPSETVGGGSGSAGSDVEVAAASSSEAFVTGPLMARQTWDFVAAAKRAERDHDRTERPTKPAAPRIAVPDRSAAATQDDADELAVVRRRREREAARGLSDEVWDSVRRSVFDKLDS